MTERHDMMPIEVKELTPIEEVMPTSKLERKLGNYEIAFVASYIPATPKRRIICLYMDIQDV